MQGTYWLAHRQLCSLGRQDSGQKLKWKKIWWFAISIWMTLIYFKLNSKPKLISFCLKAALPLCAHPSKGYHRPSSCPKKKSGHFPLFFFSSFLLLFTPYFWSPTKPCWLYLLFFLVFID